MNLFRRISAARDAFLGRKPARRAMNPAAGSRLTNDWQGLLCSPDSLMRMGLVKMRARSRELERYDDAARAFGHALKNNVLGSEGMKFQMAVKDVKFEGAKVIEKPDVYANRVIQDSRKRFDRRENYTTSRRFSRKRAHEIILQRWAFDGEIFIQKVRGANNPFKYSLRLIPADYCDQDLNVSTLPNGNEIRMGIERNISTGEHVAYYFLTARPGDTWGGHNYGKKHERLEAADVIHVASFHDPDETRGIPWLIAAMLNLQMAGGFKEAALINARVSANHVGFFTKDFPEGTDANTIKEFEDNGSIVNDTEPGEWIELPFGTKPVSVDRAYPSADFAPFIKAVLRGCSSSVGMSYMTMTGDVSDANFSSLVAGKRDEQEQWKTLQSTFEELYCQPEFEGWLNAGLLTQEIPLPLAKFDKFNAPEWTGRRWAYYNPVDEMSANEMAIQNGLRSPQEIIKEMGRDPDDVIADIADWRKQCTANGIPLNDPKALVQAGSTGKPAKPKPDDEE